MSSMQLWYSSGRPRPTFRGIIHSLMFYTTPLWATYMLAHCDTWSERISATFFLAASSTLFWASSRYHLTLWKNRKDEEAGALVDYASISAMVASSLAPMYAQIGYYWGPFVLGISYALGLYCNAQLNGDSQNLSNGRLCCSRINCYCTSSFFELDHFRAHGATSDLYRLHSWFYHLRFRNRCAALVHFPCGYSIQTLDLCGDLAPSCDCCCNIIFHC